MPKSHDFSQTLVKKMPETFNFDCNLRNIRKKIENVTFYKKVLYRFNHPFIELVLYRETQISIL